MRLPLVVAFLALAGALGCAARARPERPAAASGAASGVASGAASTQVPAPRAPTGTPDTALGLSRTSVFDVPSPPAYQAEDSSPGEKTPPPPRAFAGAPPVVPHGIADLLPITRDQNMCLDCHGVKEKKPGEPTPIPASHYVDLRRAPGKAQAAVAGSRRVCTACHVPGSDAAPLVGNAFGR